VMNTVENPAVPPSPPLERPPLPSVSVLAVTSLDVSA